MTAYVPDEPINFRMGHQYNPNCVDCNGKGWYSRLDPKGYGHLTRCDECFPKTSTEDKPNMNTKPKYEVGYEFYVPRVVSRYEKRVIKHVEENGEVFDYYRDIVHLEPVVRHKRVSHITILVKTTVETEYWCVDFEHSGLPSMYDESELVFTDAKSAMKFATDWRDNKRITYYGPDKSTDCDNT